MRYYGDSAAHFRFTVFCNYLLIYEYVIGNQCTNPWKNIARAFATKHLEKALDDVEEAQGSGRSTPQHPVVNKNQDRTLLLGGKRTDLMMGCY